MSLSEAETTEYVEEGGPVTTPPSSSSPGGRTFGLAGVVLGAGLVLSACACGPLLLVSLAAQGMLDGAIVAQALGPLALAVGMGLVLALEGWRLWQGRPPRPFYPRRTWLLWVAFLVLLTTGLLLFLLDWIPPFLLAPINALTMLLLPALVLGTVGRALRGAGGAWRDVIGGLMGGATIGTGLSMAAEVSLAVLVVTVVLAFGLLPGGMAGLESLVEQANDPAFLLDPQGLSQFLTPLVLLGALVFVAVVAPLVEEVVKTLGVGLVGPWLRPSPGRAFLLGVASGAGFALVENVLNGTVIGSFWVLGVFSRSAATLMHCATGGLMGWGWGELWTGQRPWRWLLAFVGAVSLHGVWNGLVIGTVASGLLAATHPDDMAWMAIGGLVVMALIVALLFLVAAMMVGLLWASWALGQQRAEGRR